MVGNPSIDMFVEGRSRCVPLLPLPGGHCVEGSSRRPVRSSKHILGRARWAVTWARARRWRAMICSAIFRRRRLLRVSGLAVVAWQERERERIGPGVFPTGTDLSTRDGYHGVGVVGDGRIGSADYVPSFVAVRCCTISGVCSSSPLGANCSRILRPSLSVVPSVLRGGRRRHPGQE